MNFKLFLLFISFSLFISCKRNKEDSKEYALRDSVTNQYLQLAGNPDYYDTSDMNFKVLKAYVANDTTCFQKLKEDIARINRSIRASEEGDSCIHQKPLASLEADEAYRFVFTGAFCDKKINVTVTRNGSSANMHFILFQDVWLNQVCKVISEYDKKITQEDWQHFSELMERADFWGLKSLNGRGGLDGTTLVTTGFTTGNGNYGKAAKFNYVYRWGLSTLDAPFNFVLKLSGNKQGCFVVQ